MKRFTLEKKLMAVVRYYETLYVIKDAAGERLYTGRDEKVAKATLKILNGHESRKARREELAKKRRKKKRAK